MAYFGLSLPYIAKLSADGSYAGGFKCGEAVGVSVVPAYSEGALYGDNRKVEHVTEFKEADVTLETTTMPLDAATVIFGHGTEEDGTITYNVGDSTNYVGIGWCSAEMVSGEEKYIGVVLKKVKFSESEESYTTKGDSIEFKTPKLTGKAMGDRSGDWKTKKTFDTEVAAEAWIKEKLNISIVPAA